jgi:hypothetical protein
MTTFKKAPDTGSCNGEEPILRVKKRDPIVSLSILVISERLFFSFRAIPTSESTFKGRAQGNVPTVSGNP